MNGESFLYVANINLINLKVTHICAFITYIEW
jgi:hypothetical protein